VATGLSIAGVLRYSPLEIVFAASLLTLVCLGANQLFSWAFKVPINFESPYITALILALLITPKISANQTVFMIVAGTLAMATKYILTVNKRHIFNPAAVAVALTAVVAGQSASWWVGSFAMMPAVLVGGLLIVRKVRRFAMVCAFLAAVGISTTLIGLAGQHDIVTNLQKTILHSSLFFLAFIMLTEPLTSPTTKGKQVLYALIVGALFPPQLHIGHQFTSPELALLVGNAFAFTVGFKRRLLPTFIAKEDIAPDIADFIFQPDKPVHYRAGQYMEWTLPHDKLDSRGVRRYFTLASSPTEDTLRIGIRFYPHGSSFKHALLNMNRHTTVAAGQLGGDFVLPKDPHKKLVFIAGGIGITPYRSMIKYLLDTDDKRVVTLLYSEVSVKELAYTDIFDEAERLLGVKAVYTLTGPNAPAGWKGKTGFITAEMIAAEVPDYRERIFYISGSHTMVQAMQAALRTLGVPRRQIKTDFFPGYA
jgi:ferredoxin-NADP reductase/Na+-translocating ferredoxin:NAD+ oxidoreductase RnfD subunit